MKYLKLLLCICILVFIDQFTKILAVKYLLPNGSVSIIDDIFELHYLENNGAAFGIFQNQQIFFIISTIFIIAVIVWFYNKIPASKRMLPLKIISIAVIAGAIGNFIDRITHGYVVDFLYFKLIDFPIFNVADIYVTVSCFMFLILMLFYYKENDYDFIGKNKDNNSHNIDSSNHHSEN